MLGRFSNLFDSQAAAYSKFRPSYPKELFQAIYDFGGFHNNGALAVDLATGSGQTALHLTSRFDKVLSSILKSLWSVQLSLSGYCLVHASYNLDCLKDLKGASSALVSEQVSPETILHD